MLPKIEMIDLRKAFDGKRVLDGVTLKVAKGESLVEQEVGLGKTGVIHRPLIDQQPRHNPL